MVPGGIDPKALPDLTQRAYSAHRMAGTVTAAFAIAGLMWVLLTDIVLYAVTHDPVLIARIETAKGWIFIALASLLLYAVTFRSAARLDRVRRLTAAVVDSIADGVLLLGHDRRIAYANPAAVRMLRCRLEELIGMGAADFSLRFRVSYPGGGLVPPGRYVSQRVFEEGGPLHYKITLQPAGGGELVVSAIAAGVRMSVGEPATWVVSVMHDITDTRTPGAPARPVLRGGRALAQDAGRRHQGRRAVADAGGGAEAAAHRRVDRAPVRPDRPPGAEPDGAVAVALADARAPSQRDGAPAAGRADRARRDLVATGTRSAPS